MVKPRVLFVCVHNSARSQIAEAYLKQMAGDRFEVESAGFQPGPINPLAIETMGEEGIDISRNETSNVFDFYKEGRLYSHVITVCEDSKEADCPVFPGIAKRLHWGFPNPEEFQGAWESKLKQMRVLRESIKQQVKSFYQELTAAGLV